MLYSGVQDHEARDSGKVMWSGGMLKLITSPAAPANAGRDLGNSGFQEIARKLPRTYGHVNTRTGTPFTTKWDDDPPLRLACPLRDPGNQQ
jgi:hypothetical protein